MKILLLFVPLLAIVGAATAFALRSAPTQPESPLAGPFHADGRYALVTGDSTVVPLPVIGKTHSALILADTLAFRRETQSYVEIAWVALDGKKPTRSLICCFPVKAEDANHAQLTGGTVGGTFATAELSASGRLCVYTPVRRAGYSRWCYSHVPADSTV